MQITSEVPLSEMFGYATDMRSKTQGRGQYTMEPSHYAEVPKSVSENDHRFQKKRLNKAKYYLIFLRFVATMVINSKGYFTE